MRNNKNGNINADNSAEHRTHAIMDEASRDSESGVIITTQRGVDDAKEFVEKNQK